MKYPHLQPTDTAKAIPALITGLVETGRNILQTIETDPATAIHDFRRYMKMARAALRLGRKALDRQDFDSLNGLLRNALSGLSGLRDEDALIEISGWLEKKQRKPVAALIGLAAAALRARQSRQADPDTAGAVRQAMDLTARAIELLQQVRFHTDAPPEQVIAGGVQRVYAAGRRYIRMISSGYPAQDIWHGWRKRAKDLRYQAGFISPAWPAYCRFWEEELHHLTDCLGRQRDVFLLMERLKQPEIDWPEPVREETDLLLNMLEKARVEQARKAWVLGRKLYLDPPKWWGSRIASLWRAHRDQHGTGRHE